MNGLVKRSDVIETAKKFTFTDEHEKRKFLDLLDYCLKETKTAYDVDVVVEELKSLSNAEADYYYASSNDVIDRETTIEIVRKGGVDENNN